MSFHSGRWSVGCSTARSTVVKPGLSRLTRDLLDACAPDRLLATRPMATSARCPRYYELGLTSDGDPSLAFGPRPGADGKFSWANGSRLYYANLASNASAQRSERAFNGSESIAVSRTDDVIAAASGANSAWMAPVIVSRQNSALFSDKDAVWADNAATSPFFGNVYVCNVAFRSVGKNGSPEPVMFARSTDGGDTWKQQQITAATNNARTGGRRGLRNPNGQ